MQANCQGTCHQSHQYLHHASCVCTVRLCSVTYQKTFAIYNTVFPLIEAGSLIQAGSLIEAGGSDTIVLIEAEGFY